MKRRGCSAGIMLAIIGSFVHVTSAVAESPRRPVRNIGRESAGVGTQDPIGWVSNAKIDCTRISDKVNSRYGDILSINNTAKSSQLLVEEFKFIRQETCESAKYQFCKFNWCSSKSAALKRSEEGSPSSIQDPRAALVASASDAAASGPDFGSVGVVRISGSFRPSTVPNQYKAEFKLSDVISGGEKTAIAEKAGLAVPAQPTNLELKTEIQPVAIAIPGEKVDAAALKAEVKLDKPAKAIPASESGIVPLVDENVDKNVISRSEAILAKLTDEKKAQYAMNIARQVKKEKAENINWRVIEVPGASRIFRDTSADSAANAGGTRVIAPAGGLPRAGTAVLPPSARANTNSPAAAAGKSLSGNADKGGLSKQFKKIHEENDEKIKEYQRQMAEAGN